MVNKVAGACATLELTGPISQTSVRQAYRRQMLRWHPDLHHGAVSHVLAAERAKAINAAYEFLSEIAEQKGAWSVASAEEHYSDYRTRHTYEGERYAPGFSDPAVFETFVKSSNILSIGYAKQSRMLFIKFRDGSIYRYERVPPSVFEELLRAESHGKYAHRRIYGHYSCARC